MNGEISKQYQIVSLSSDEWEKVRAIRLEALKADPKAFGSSYVKELEYTKEKWQSRLLPFSAKSKSWSLYLKKGDEIVGIMGAFISEENVPTIVSVYIRSSERGKGLGKLMMEKMVNMIMSLNKYHKIELTVNAEQTAAFLLYKGMGFRIVSQKAEMMGDGKSYIEYTMEKAW